MHLNPISLSNPAVSHISNKTYNVQRSHPPFSSTAISHRPPVDIEFPRFGEDEADDPISYVEKCEEYLAL